MREQIIEKRSGKISKGVTFLQDKSLNALHKFNGLHFELVDLPHICHIYTQTEKALEKKRYSANEEVIDTVEQRFADQDKEFYF
mgnify:FL=1